MKILIPHPPVPLLLQEKGVEVDRGDTPHTPPERPGLSGLSAVFNGDSTGGDATLSGDWRMTTNSPKEVQDTSCRGFGGVPHSPYNSPQDWGEGGLKELFSGELTALGNLTCQQLYAILANAVKHTWG